MAKTASLWVTWVFVALLALAGRAGSAEPDLLLPANLKTMGCAKPDTRYVLLRSSRPGNVFYPGEAVDLTVRVTRDDEPLRSVSLGVLFRVNNNKGPALTFGADKSATKTNGLSLHPYWQANQSCTVRWTLAP